MEWNIIQRNDLFKFFMQIFKAWTRVFETFFCNEAPYKSWNFKKDLDYFLLLKVGNKVIRSIYEQPDFFSLNKSVLFEERWLKYKYVYNNIIHISRISSVFNAKFFTIATYWNIFQNIYESIYLIILMKSCFLSLNCMYH